MDIIEAYKTVVLIKGMAKRAVVTIEIEPDQPDFEYWDQKDKEDTELSLSKDLIQCVYIQVRISFSDLQSFEGYDTLGQVFTRNSSVKKDVLSTVLDHAMVANATKDLIDQVLQAINRIEEFLTKKGEVSL